MNNQEPCRRPLITLQCFGKSPTFLADRTATQYDWLHITIIMSSLRLSVCLSVCLLFSLAATSALGHVTVALASAAPELDSTLINKLTDDKRSVVFDGAVHSVFCLFDCCGACEF